MIAAYLFVAQVVGSVVIVAGLLLAALSGLERLTGGGDDNAPRNL